MWITRKKYKALVNKIDEIKKCQKKLELLIDEKLLCMAKKILREPEKLTEELDEKDRMEKYISDIINH